MTTGTIQIATLISNYERTTSELLALLRSHDEKGINQKPDTGMWSMAQVADHIRLSNNSIAKALALKGKPLDRHAGERVNELKAIFLDFQKKFQSPDFILPTKDIYNPDQLLNELEQSIRQINNQMYEAELNELINHPAFGDISKFEIFHFVLYHTQRHLQQVKNIIAAL